MATLIGEQRTRDVDVGADKTTHKRSFKVRATDRTESDRDIVSAVGIGYGVQFPGNPFLYARSFKAKQDTKTWWLWIVTVTYEPYEGESTTGEGGVLENPEDDPVLRPPQISYYTESVQVAARGEVDADGLVTKAIVTSAGEPYDPHPEEELEILYINIRLWRGPTFSVDQYVKASNSVNDAAFTFGDVTFEEGRVKIKSSVGPIENIFLSQRQTQIFYRELNFELAVHPFSWDLSLLDFGTYYLDDGEVKRFADKGMEMGLLDGFGGELGTQAPKFNTWKNRKRFDFGLFNLPKGP